MNSEVESKTIRYVFIDVVSFTEGRSVEAQTAIVGALNAITLRAMARSHVNETDTILLPTGDGLGIAILDQTLPHDIHLKLGLVLLSEVNKRNRLVKDSSRKFHIRVGINQNTDNIVTDINKRRNVAGAGVNLAQRIMDVGDASNLMVGSIVYSDLNQREKYMKSFRRILARIKHNRQIAVYQYVANGHRGLITDIPKAYAKSEPEKEYTLSEFDAFYMSYCIALENFITKHHVSFDISYYALVVLIWYLAKDSYEQKTRKPYETYSKKVYGDDHLTLDQLFKHYDSVEFTLISDLAGFLYNKLSHLGQYYDHGVLFINEAGKSKIQSEFPNILSLVEQDEKVQKAILSS